MGVDVRGGRAVKAGRRPPRRGLALRARSDDDDTMVEEALRGFLVAPCRCGLLGTELNHIWTVSVVARPG